MNVEKRMKVYIVKDNTYYKAVKIIYSLIL